MSRPSVPARRRKNLLDEKSVRPYSSFVHPVTIHADSIHELDDELGKTLEQAQDHRPNLAVVFASDMLVSEELCRVFAQHGLTVFGCSSREEISSEALKTDSIVVMLLDIPPGWFKRKIFKVDEAHDLGRSVGHWSRNAFADPALLLLQGGGGGTINGDYFLAGFFEAAPGLPIYGGLASADDTLSKFTFFTENEIHDDGMLGLVFDRDKIELNGVAVSGWEEIGTPKEITRSEGNIVYEIEGMPATDFYARYFKVKAGSREDQLLASEYPISLRLPDGAKVIRTAVRIDGENKCVIYGGSIPQGTKVRFCSPNIVETVQQTIAQMQTFRAEHDAHADAVLLFDCAIRSNSFGRYMWKEVEVIRDLWGVPLVGFSSWGEIGNAPGEACGFHNTTISLVVITNKESRRNHAPVKTMTSDEVASAITTFEGGATPEALAEEVRQLRRQKNLLSHFLHLTSDDLDRALMDVDKEREKSEELLLNILPQPIAQRLKAGERTIADDFDSVSILFADLVGFTKLSSDKSAAEIVKLLNRLFINFDELAVKYGVEKIKTIGDAYMVVAGLPEPSEDHALRIMKMARGMLNIMKQFNEKYATDLDVRVGINSGPVVAGVIGRRKFVYDLWGDSVNVASRMESSGVAGRIHVSRAARDLLKDQYEFERRGEIEVKGKGLMETFFY